MSKPRYGKGYGGYGKGADALAGVFFFQPKGSSNVNRTASGSLKILKGWSEETHSEAGNTSPSTRNGAQHPNHEPT